MADDHVDGWHPRWRERFQALIRDGLHATTELVLSRWYEEGLYIVRVHPLQDPRLWAPRFGSDRRDAGLTDWHISVAEESAISPEQVEKLYRRWNGAAVHLKFEDWVTSGGTLLLAPSCIDEDLAAAHRASVWYGDRDLHISF